MGDMSTPVIAIIVITVVVILVAIAIIVWCYCRRGNYSDKEDKYEPVKRIDEEAGLPDQQGKHDQYRRITVENNELTPIAEEPIISKSTQDKERRVIPSKDFNTLFYFNKKQSAPDGDYADEIHSNWWGDYDKLERHHGYIQWLFPIVGEQGLNPDAKELRPHEAEAIIQDAEAMERVLKSYRMMLDFYGMKMTDATTGVVERGSQWDDRFYHLNHSHHNYLRITRILKSIGSLGYDHLQAPLIEFLISEIVDAKTLTNCSQSCKNFWIKAVKDEEARARLEEMLP